MANFRVKIYFSKLRKTLFIHCDNIQYQKIGKVIQLE